MTLQQKYQLIKYGYKKAALTEIASKFNYSLRHFRDEKFYKDKLTDAEIKYCHKVFDLNLSFQEKENNMYKNLRT